MDVEHLVPKSIAPSLDNILANLPRLPQPFGFLVSLRKTLEDEELMRYTGPMTIEHQMIVDAEGNPTAAVIPWDDFQELLAELEANEIVNSEWKEEIANRAREIDEGMVELIDGDDFLKRLESV